MAKRSPNHGALMETTAPGQPAESLHHEEDHWDEPELPRQQIAAELQLLQGSWISIGGKYQAEFLIAGRLYTARFENNTIYMGSLELIPTAVPKKMTMWVEEGPAHHKGKMAACLYEVDGDHLRFCATQPGNSEALDDFPAENDPNYVLLVFRRAPRKGL